MIAGLEKIWVPELKSLFDQQILQSSSILRTLDSVPKDCFARVHKNHMRNVGKKIIDFSNMVKIFKNN